MEVRKVGVVGLGAMGAGIAQLCVEAGVDTVGREVTLELAEKAHGRIAHFLTRKVEKGQLEQGARDEAVGRLTLTTELDDFADCDLVIEAIVEELEPKRELFAELDRICRPDAVLATNTSALSVTEIAAATTRPERVVGMHFFNPAPLMPLVEIVRAELTADEPFETAFAFGERIGKTPIRCHDTPGFVVNRVLIPLLNDCIRVLDEARVTPEDLDTGNEERRRLADGAVHARRPRRHRRARARVRGAVREDARAADGAAAAARRDAERGPARPQVRPRLLSLRRRLRSGKAGKLRLDHARRPLTLSLHEYHPRHTLRADTGSVMRKTFLLLALLALASRLPGVAAPERGRRNPLGRGRPWQGHDPGARRRHRPARPRDRHDLRPHARGCERARTSSATTSRSCFVGETGSSTAGSGLRFRLIGGKYRIVIQGRGIDLSVVGKGFGSIKGDPGQLGVLLARRRRLQERPREPASCCPRSRSASCSRPRARREEPGPPRGRRMTAGAQTILVVEDEASIASFVSLYLKNAGYDVRAVTTGGAALTQVASEQPALIILDLMLPDIDGIEICRRVRKTSDVPILMLTARDEDVDKIIGLEVGADDYLTKPFNPRELVARVKSVLRRSAPERRRDVEEELHHGELSINAGRREVKVGEEEIQLAPKEFDLLWELLDHKGLVLTRDQLLERVWGYTFAGDTRTVDVHVRQLRRKLGDASPIVTVWGVGYKVGPDRAPAPAA